MTRHAGPDAEFFPSTTLDVIADELTRHERRVLRARFGTGNREPDEPPSAWWPAGGGDGSGGTGGAPAAPTPPAGPEEV